jgi:hypothetical protein
MANELLSAALSYAARSWPVLASPAAIINGSLPESARGGDTVTVPYFNSMGELEDVAENAALTPATLTQITETAVAKELSRLRPLRARDLLHRRDHAELHLQRHRRSGVATWRTRWPRISLRSSSGRHSFPLRQADHLPDEQWRDLSLQMRK